MSDQAHIIWNANAGSASQLEEWGSRLSDLKGVKLVETKSPDDARKAALAGLKNGVPRIIAAGGDGTVSAVASTLVKNAGHHSSLGILPLGTGNDLARSIGFPLDPMETLEGLLQAKPVLIDVIEARTASSSRVVVNMATAGNSGKFAESVSSEVKQQWGPLAYLRTALAAIPELDVYTVTIKADGCQEKTFKVLNVFIANGKTSGGGFRVAPMAQLDDGMFDYLLVQDGTIAALAGVAADYAFDRLLENDLIVSGKAKSIHISSQPSLQFSADGEIVDEVIESFTVVNKALSVLAGPEFAGAAYCDDADNVNPLIKR